MKTVDKVGNKLFLHDDGIYLHLIKETQPRKILSFTSGRIVKFLKKSNVMRAGQMVGFNYHALRLVQQKFPRHKDIYLRYGNKPIKAPLATILLDGQFLHFKKEGFELQTFYPLEKFR